VQKEEYVKKRRGGLRKDLIGETWSRIEGKGNYRESFKRDSLSKEHLRDLGKKKFFYRKKEKRGKSHTNKSENLY